MKKTYEAPQAELIMFTPMEKTNGDDQNLSANIIVYDPTGPWT